MNYRFCFLTFCFLTFLIPLRNIVLKIDKLFSDIPILNTTNLLFGLLIICPLLQERRYNIYKPKLTLPIILYCSYFFFQIFNANNPYKLDLFIFWKDRFLFPVLLFFITASILKSKREVLILLAVMVFANFYMDTYFWRWVRWLNLESFHDKIKKVNGTFGDIGGCNEWAAFFSTYIFLYLAAAKYLTHKSIRQISRAMTAANFLVMLFSFSRGSYLAFLIGNLWYSIKVKKYGFLVVFVLMIACYQTVLPKSVVQRIEMTFQPSETGEIQDQDVTSRLEMWEYAWDHIQKNPIWGYGLLSFRYDRYNNPHNEYLYLFYQGGIIGIALFTWLFVAAFSEASYLFRISSKPLEKFISIGMCAGTISLATANLFGDRWTYLPITGYFWILNGIIVFLIREKLSTATLHEH